MEELCKSQETGGVSKRVVIILDLDEQLALFYQTKALQE